MPRILPPATHPHPTWDSAVSTLDLLNDWPEVCLPGEVLTGKRIRPKQTSQLLCELTKQGGVGELLVSDLS